MRSRWPLTVVLTSILVLAFVGASEAQVKQRVDLTGRQDVAPEEIVDALKSRQRRQSSLGLKRAVQPRLATLALSVHFTFDSATISTVSEHNLQSLGKALQSPQLASLYIRIEGHTDNVGDEVYNKALSERRAQSVKQYLVQNFGIESKRLVTEGHGEDEPIADNQSRTGRSKSRRVEFVNLGQL